MQRRREEVTWGSVLALEIIGLVVAAVVSPALGVSPFVHWAGMVGGLLLAGYLGRRWDRARMASKLCMRCQYPLESFMARCPECGLGKDGSEPPIQKVVVKDGAKT